MVKKMDNYNFLMKTDVSKFIGEWVAVSENKIVSHGSSFKEVLLKAKEKCPHSRPLMSRVPKEDSMIF